MLQSNLIFGIQKRIKEGSKHASKMGLIQESQEVTEENPIKRAELILESSLISGIYEKTSNAQKKEEFKKGLITESFHLSKVKRKLEKDTVYFNYLYENYVLDSFKDQYKMLLESVFSDTVKLYQEADVTPRLVSQSLDTNELNENQIIDIYKNRLNETIKNKYTKPLLSGKINEVFENEIRTLTTKLITEGSSIDIEQVKVYLPFEETIYQFNKEILIPKIAESRVEAFMESMTEDYLNFIDESAAEILSNIEKKVKLLSSMISPNMFDAAVDAEGIDAPKMAGISITVDKNFDDDTCDDGICPDEVADMDPEAAEELADEEEASQIEDENEDLIGEEEISRDKLDMANDTEDYEDISNMEPKAEESAATEIDGDGDGSEQPGAIELDLNLQDGDLNPSDSLSTNDHDVSLSGTGEGDGVDPNGEAATLPGGVDNIGTDIDSDDSEISDDELQGKEEVSSDDVEIEDELEDVSEKSSKDKETISEGTMDSSLTNKDNNLIKNKGK